MLVAIKIRKNNYRITRRLSLHAKSGLGVVLSFYKDDLKTSIKLYNL